jgi:hypothetical protein
MRSALVLGGVVGVLVSAARAPAQEVPAAPRYVQKTIMVSEVEVRCKPSPSYYATSKLKRGAAVLVLDRGTKDHPGWLEIKPPPGSFSWVNSAYLEQQKDHIAIVKEGTENTPTVPVLVGSTVLDRKPDVEALKLKRGTMVVIVGQPMQADGGSWVPIEPTPQEVRYIPEDAVKGSTEIPVAAAGPGPQGAGPGGGPASVSPSQGVINQADRAFQSRDYAQARQLYETALRQSADANERSYCYGRLSELEKTLGQQVAASPAGKTTSLYNTGPAPGVTPGGPQWSSWGRLRKTTFQKDGRPMYVLESTKGEPLLYATTSPNLTLESYVNRDVCLYGQITYSSDQYYRNNTMTVTHVALPPR